MVTRKKRTLENPTGLGEVWEANKKIAKVRYNLSVQQEILIQETFGSNQELEGHKMTTGSIFVLEGERNLIGKNRLVLHMQDGRKVDFLIKSIYSSSGSYQVQQAGDFYY